jgi:predicted DNA-binding protein
MAIHDHQRAERLRAAATERLKAIATWQALVKNTYLRDRLRLLQHHFEDMENFFIAQLCEERTPAAEAEWLHHAESFFSIYSREFDHFNGLISRYDPNLQTIG